MKFITAGIITLFVGMSSALADTWGTTPITITKIQVLDEWIGGLIRVWPGPGVNPGQCTYSDRADYVFDMGTSETRAALISGLYMAYAAGKKVTFYIDSDCSVVDTPIIRGIAVED